MNGDGLMNERERKELFGHLMYLQEHWEADEDIPWDNVYKFCDDLCKIHYKEGYQEGYADCQDMYGDGPSQ